MSVYGTDDCGEFGEYPCDNSPTDDEEDFCRVSSDKGFKGCVRLCVLFELFQGYLGGGACGFYVADALAVLF